MITVNAIGDACPIPVVKTRKAMETIKGSEVVETLVDNEIAVENLKKMAGQMGYQVKDQKLDQNLSAEGNFQAADSDEAVQAKYKTLETFTTNTTSNPKRNTNVRLAAEALNGTIVQPGEEFSFNQVIGPRTEEKGYQAAAAYNSGEVVQEVGGGPGM